LERYELKIESIKREIASKQEHILDVDDEIDELRANLDKYKKLQKQLPERHQFPWDRNEKNNLKKALKHFVAGMARNHKRTPVAIAARIKTEKWLVELSNGDYE